MENEDYQNKSHYFDNQMGFSSSNKLAAVWFSMWATTRCPTRVTWWLMINMEASLKIDSFRTKKDQKKRADFSKYYFSEDCMLRRCYLNYHFALRKKSSDFVITSISLVI